MNETQLPVIDYECFINYSDCIFHNLSNRKSWGMLCYYWDY